MTPYPYLDAFLDMLATQRGVSLHTLSAYRTDLVKWFRFFAPESMCAIQQDHIYAYVAYLRTANLSERSIARHISALRQFIYFLISEHVMTHNPMDTMPPMTKTRIVLPRMLDRQDLRHLMHAARQDESPEGIRLWTLVELLYATGMRVSELIGLKNFTTPQTDTPCTIIKGKGGHERYIFFTPLAIKALRAYACVRPLFDRTNTNVYLFPSTGKSGHITRQRVGQLLTQLAHVCGIHPSLCSPHKIRHAFATHLMEKGVNLVTLKQLLGHQDLSTTQMYTHVQPDQWTKVLEQCHPMHT